MALQELQRAQVCSKEVTKQVFAKEGHRAPGSEPCGCALLAAPAGRGHSTGGSHCLWSGKGSSTRKGFYRHRSREQVLLTAEQHPSLMSSGNQPRWAPTSCQGRTWDSVMEGQLINAR